MTAKDTAEWLARFEEGALEPAEFNHQGHLRVIWLLLQRHDVPEATARFKAGVKRLIARAGGGDKYHETITCALTALVAQRMARLEEAAGDWRAFQAANPDLFTQWRACLDRYYRSETLNSPLAKTLFLLPDRGVA